MCLAAHSYSIYILSSLSWVCQFCSSFLACLPPCTFMLIVPQLHGIGLFGFISWLRPSSVPHWPPRFPHSQQLTTRASTHHPSPPNGSMHPDYILHRQQYTYWLPFFSTQCVSLTLHTPHLRAFTFFCTLYFRCNRQSTKPVISYERCSLPRHTPSTTHFSYK